MQLTGVAVKVIRSLALTKPYSKSIVMSNPVPCPSILRCNSGDIAKRLEHGF